MHTRSSGISKVDRDLWESWKVKGRVIEEYNNVELPYIDIKDSLSLYMEDPCKYIVADRYVNADFILDYVLPKMKGRVPKKVCTV